MLLPYDALRPCEALRPYGKMVVRSGWPHANSEEYTWWS
jgi:hypothetical protein